MTTPPTEASPRSGSATSLVLTIIGLYLRRTGGWVATADLVNLAGEIDVSVSLARTAIARLKKRGLLVAEQREAAGYALPARAQRILAQGDRRIFSARIMGPSDPWCVISFSIPESMRAVRGQLRRRLTWIGGGLIAPALWICPDFLRDEVEQILDELDVRRFAVLLRTDRPTVSGALEGAVQQWWDLDRIARLHEEFIDRVEPLLVEPARDDADAFRRYVVGIDAWRLIPYLDPGLPYDLLPVDWPGRTTTRLLATLSERFADAAWGHVRRVPALVH